MLLRAKDRKGGQTATICGASVYGRPSDVMLFLLYPHTHVCNPGLTLKPKYTNGFLAFLALSLFLDRHAACSSFRLMRGVSLRLFLLSFTSEAQSPSRSKSCLFSRARMCNRVVAFLLRYPLSAVCCSLDVLLSADNRMLERITHPV